MLALASSARTAPQGQPWRENLRINLICPECKESPPNIAEHYSAGDLVCGSCGLVLGGRIVDDRSEWRTFSNDNEIQADPSRVGDGPNPLLHGSQLQTAISSSGGVGIGGPKSSNKSRDLQRAQNKSTNDRANKILMEAYQVIDSYSGSMQLPAIVSNTTKHLFKIASEGRAVKGKSQATVIAGCIFIACRQCRVPRTFKEIVMLTKVSKGELGRIFKILEKLFTAHNQEKMDSLLETGGIPDPHETYETTTSGTPAELCARFCSHLALPGKFTKVPQQLCDKTASITNVYRRGSPLSIAGTCIFMASHVLGMGRNLKDVATAAGVSEQTLKKYYKELYPHKAALFEELMKSAGKKFDLTALPLP